MPEIKQGRFKKRIAIQVSMEADVVKKLDEVRGLFSRSGVAAEMIIAGINSRLQAAQTPAKQEGRVMNLKGTGSADF